MFTGMLNKSKSVSALIGSSSGGGGMKQHQQIAAADNIDKQIRKIEKSEDKAIKILNKQHRDLSKTLDANERLIEQKLDKGTPVELKLEAEIEKTCQWGLTESNKVYSKYPTYC